MIDVRLPGDQFEGTRAQVLRWLKRVGDRVIANEPLLELETDKVTVEVPAPDDGVLREILKQEKQDVGSDDVLGRLEAAETGVATKSAPVTGATGAVESAAVAPQVSAKASASGDSIMRLRLSPAVRRLLSERQLDPSGIVGTGRSGRITAADVLKASPPDQAAATDRVTAPVPHRAPDAPPKSPVAGVERIAHSATRRRTAERMVESLLKTSPHVTSVFEVDLSAVLAHRAKHKGEFARQGVPLTLTAYFTIAAVAAIRAVPESNARWTDDALELYPAIHLGIATAVEGTGLLVPVLRDAQLLSLSGVAERLADLTERARAGKLTPADVKGGTFTISNHGVSGSLLATPIVINPPQTAILGIGKLEKRVVVMERDGEDSIAVRPRAYATLTIDHRVMDGHRANAFLSTFVSTLERWGS